jgi:deazaflavin-dependent oxidoreductase (nitroreductase family)
MRHLITWLLRSPVHRLVSRSVLLLTIVGRTSGRAITFPVQYAASDSGLVIFPGHFERKQWWRNLQHASPIEVLLEGTRRTGTGRTLAAEPAESDDAIAAYLRRFPRARRVVDAARDEAHREGIAVPVVVVTLA